MKPETKAELINIGRVDIDTSLLGRVTIPTAGPGAGKSAFFFRSGGHRVRLTVDETSRLQAVAEDGDIVIMKGGEEMVRGQIEDELIHCPEQAYVNMTEKCIFDCKFCPVPKLDGKIKSIEEVLELVDKAYQTGTMKAISITSGVAETPEIEVDRAVEVVRRSKRYGVPIGVCVYPTPDSTRRLKDAGAHEIKYNVETMDRPIYQRSCPGQDLDMILHSLKDAVDIFGRNRVCSNFIIGLGETDDSVEKGIRELVSLGVVPILRPASMHPLRQGEVVIERPSAERILKLTRILRTILDENGLRADSFRTMCLPCAGCDLNPHSDLDAGDEQ
ncbi:MAG: radical SAM protein [Euryarchaeota archaeon]|nr:radical SAM protein [Euryarchaeota archaeon]